MSKKPHILCLSMGILILGLALSLAPTTFVRARYVCHPRIKRVVHNHSRRPQQRSTQHHADQYRYQRMRKFHLNNLHKIKNYRREHQHRRLQIEKRKIRQIKRRKATKRHPYSPVVWNRNYHFDENYKRDVKTSRPYQSYREISGNDRIKFSRFLYLHYLEYVRRKKNHGYRHGDPQSMVILPNGYLYVLYNSAHGNGHINQIFEYNVKNGKIIRLGRQFNGGHGQGLNYDSRLHQLWLCMNMYRYKGQPRGILGKDLLLAKINQKTLKPSGHWIHVHFHRYLGDNVAYDKLGNYWNVAVSYRHHDKSAPYDSLQIYQGRNRRIRMVKDILHSPSACIQNLTYNPQNGRLYVIGNGIIMSFPINHIHHLTNRDIRVSVMNHHSEFEDLAFWKNRAYLLVHPDWILRSNKSF